MMGLEGVNKQRNTYFYCLFIFTLTDGYLAVSIKAALFESCDHRPNSAFGSLCFILWFYYQNCYKNENKLGFAAVYTAYNETAGG